MKILFFGTGAFGLPALEALKNSPHPLAGVVSTQDKPRGRGLGIKASPVREWAVQNGFPVLDYSAAEVYSADVFVVIAFGRILPRRILDQAKRMSLNVHASLLPRYRGAAPVHWALLKGDKETGVSVIRMTEKLDAGDIVTQKTSEIANEDDFVSLNARLAGLGARALLEALDLIAKEKELFRPQEESLASVARKITKEDGRIPWTDEARSVRNRIRALREWPGAYSFYEKKRVLFRRAEVSGDKAAGAGPGEILEASEKGEIRIACADRVIRVFELQQEGRKPLAAADFLMGFRLKPGTFFE